MTMADRRNSPTPPHHEPRREFAFSRIAGATAGDYAAVSSLAVVAVVAAMLGLLGVFWVWWLIVPGISLAMGGLALYYISTSAGTQTGRKIALTAIAISLAFGLMGAIVHLNAYRVQEANKQHVRSLAAGICRDVQAGRFDTMYQQLAPQYRNSLPLGHWVYEWRRTLAQAGQPSRVELSDRVMAINPEHILTTMNVYFPPLGPGQPERVYPIRLVYARGQSAGPQDQAEDAEQQADDVWELAKVPNFVNRPAMPYPQPLVWPSPGKVERLARRGDWLVVVKEFAADGRTDPPATLPDQAGVVELVDKHLAPEPPLYGAWLPQPQ